MTNPLPSWSKLPLLLSLLILMPQVGLAAQDAPLATSEEEVPTAEDVSSDADIPGTDESEPLRLMDEPEPRPRRRGAPLGLRILAEAAAGSLTSSAGALVGGLAGLGLCAAAGCGGYYGLDILLAIGLGAGVGSIVGYPLGVWWGGEATGGDGKLLMAMAGLGVGTIAGLLLSIPTFLIDRNGALAGSVVGLAAISGPILFYELSNRNSDPNRYRDMAALTPSRPGIQPVLSFSRTSAHFGLAGAF
jgi:hypothetical protein